MKRHKADSELHNEADEVKEPIIDDSAKESLNVDQKEVEEEKGVEGTPESAEINRLNDKYLRLAAEFDNFRRRTLKEKQELILTAGEDIIVGVLPVLDDFERALDMLNKADGDNSTAIEGTDLIYNKLLSFLTSKGLKVIEAQGGELDTDFHEAIAQIPVEEKKKKNRIIDVVQKGYTLNGKVIRFAKVVVGQ
ncbi:MAG: nucleotide exchange factor GrpE [Bacteroidales bacterium]|nr:nucleotide exchange factor GrpE [Bacteroidales bacterium]